MSLQRTVLLVTAALSTNLLAQAPASQDPIAARIAAAVAEVDAAAIRAAIGSCEVGSCASRFVVRAAVTRRTVR